MPEEQPADEGAPPVTGASATEQPAQVTGGPKPETPGVKPKAKKKAKAKPKPQKYQAPTQVKAHTPKHAPKSELPKGYQHPVAAPKGSETLKPSAYGAAREKEVAESHPDFEKNKKAEIGKQKSAPKRKKK